MSLIPRLSYLCYLLFNNCAVRANRRGVVAHVDYSSAGQVLEGHLFSISFASLRLCVRHIPTSVFQPAQAYSLSP